VSVASSAKVWSLGGDNYLGRSCCLTPSRSHCPNGRLLVRMRLPVSYRLATTWKSRFACSRSMGRYPVSSMISSPRAS
jgi:hypothetical protein